MLFFIAFGQPKTEEHQEDGNTGCSKKEGGQKLLYRCKQAHANSNNEVDHVEKNEGMYSFIHWMFFCLCKCRIFFYLFPHPEIKYDGPDLFFRRISIWVEFKLTGFLQRDAPHGGIGGGSAFGLDARTDHIAGIVDFDINCHLGVLIKIILEGREAVDFSSF
jgi:hypothetical protein